MYQLLKEIFIIIASFLLLICVQPINAQSQYQMNIANGVLVNSKTFEFDVFIRSISDAFLLTSYQCSLTFNNDIANSGSLSFSYIPGSSKLFNTPYAGIGLNSSDGIQKLTFASMPGIDTINQTAIKVGRFRLRNTNIFNSVDPDINWNFDGHITTILTGSNFSNITIPSDHNAESKTPAKLQVVQVTASGTSSSDNGPEKTVDGKGFSGGDINSIWMASPLPQHLIFDLGYQCTVSFARFSFGNFNDGRVYTYSVFLSNDKVDWTEVVSNATSGFNEWTENQFPANSIRYIKLLITWNNQNYLASVWEAEIWGFASSTPLELVSFTGNVLDNRMELKWTTATEINNKGFEIYRSKDGESRLIGFVEGKGSSSEINDYKFIDETGVKAGTYSYRLKQIDYDGSYEYSEEVTVELVEQVKEYALLQNYPNPFNPVTKIRFQLPEESEVELRVYNSIGEQIAELVKGRLTTGSHEVEFNAGEIASGIYFYQLKTGTYTQIKKMIVMK